ncbi:lipocalin-like domain-containing protein [Microbacter margulisiae]|uniref:Lipocalin-like domain-containing protein n=1 Tax=Microbacter margulisiae TaxID=1350067 RepID=A0A7W5DQG5_9PORP|nr:lipocalin-like domain-containing protein [Microbacter margulisiae]MBB3186433.1 hypothetical protein [Microbacter margulisiae]
MNIKKYLLISCLLMGIFLLAGCHNYNPDLNGKWQLMTISTPTQTIVRDSIFYNFDNYTFEVQNMNRNTNPNGGVLLGEFHQIGDSLILQVVDNWYIPSHFYWNSLEKRFKIVSISLSRLRLSENDSIYTFRSYN